MNDSTPNNTNSTTPSPDDYLQRVKAAQDTLRKSSEYVIYCFSEQMEQAEALADALVQALKPPSPVPDDYPIYAHRLAELLYEHLCSTSNQNAARRFLLGEEA